jgi:hypothetical protein
LEAYAILRRDPDKIIQFDVDYPAKAVTKLKGSMLFPPQCKVDVLAFDGHFGVTRQRDEELEPKRKIQRKCRPKGSKNKQKGLKEHQRSASCALKKTHVALPNRTGGWQFVGDPTSRKIVGAAEHLDNETHQDKLSLLEDVMDMDDVDPDVLMHDDMCHFEPYAKKRSPKKFAKVKHWIIDWWHLKNHKCAKNKWTRAQKKRCAKVRSNMAESFNAWIRSLNFYLNGLRTFSHRFWVEEAILFYNANLQDIPIRITRRSTAAARKRPAHSR